MKYLSMLGFAQSAGGILSGEIAVERSLARGSVHLLLLAADASSKTQKNFTMLATRYQIPCIIADVSKEQLGKSIGKPMRSIVALTNEHFAHEVQQALKTMTGQTNSGSDEYGENKDL